MEFPTLPHIAAAIASLVALDESIAYLAGLIRDNWPAIRAALRGEHRP